MTAVLDQRVPELLDDMVRYTPPAPPVRQLEAQARSRDISDGLYVLLRVVATLSGLWLTRHGLTTSTPAGADIYGHVARTDFALDELFPAGRVDGWFPGLGAGYRLFAVNGPGLAVAAGIVRLATLGTATTAQSFAILGPLSIASLPWAVASLGRELGATRLAATIGGLLALFVSFYAGGGLAALYGPGLIAQSVALPLQVLALARVIRAMRHGSTRATAAAAFVVALLALTHPISILVLGLFVPLGIAGDWFRAPLRRTLRGVAVALWAAALAAFWLVPALRVRELRGTVATWAIPPLPTRMAEVWRGDVLWPQALAVAAGAAAVITLSHALVSRSRWRRLRPFGAAAVFLTVAHLAVGHRLGPFELVVQLPTRGLALAAILAMQPLAELVGDLVTAARRLLPAAPQIVGVSLALCVPWQLDGLLDPRQVAIPPSPSLERAADELARLIPPMGRHLLVEPPPTTSVGTDQPSRWLAVESATNSAHLYFWEATRENLAGVLAADLIEHIAPQDALAMLRRVGVTHVVTASGQDVAALTGLAGFRPVWAEGQVTIFEVQAAPGGPPVGALLQPEQDAPAAGLDAVAVVQEPEHLAWEVDAGADVDVVAAVAFDPAWQPTVDGRRVAVDRSADGLVQFPVLAGHHEVGLRFTAARADSVGVSLTVLGILGLVGLGGGWVRRRWGWGRALYEIKQHH